MKRQSGFTLLEIIIVFVLIAGLLAVVVPKIAGQSEAAQAREAKIRLQTLVGNIELYKLEVGRYPASLQDLAKQPAGADKWNGPYAKDVDLKDSWGHDYVYTVPGASGKPYDLISLGSDGQPGGEGAAKDIAN